jgi:hypothetical protein
MNVFRPNLRQILTDIGEPTDGESTNTGRPPHHASLEGPLVAHCKLGAGEQTWLTEERGFERRLQRKVRELHSDGTPNDDLERFITHHRSKWRNMRRGKEPQSMRLRAVG